MNERRQNVRVHPAADYDIIVEYVSGLVSVRLQVIDIAIGGMGLVVDELFAGAKVGTTLARPSSRLRPRCGTARRNWAANAASRSLP